MHQLAHLVARQIRRTLGRRESTVALSPLPNAAIAVCFFGCLVGAEAAQVDVAEELARLASAYGFTVSGDEHVQDAIGRAESDLPYPRVRL
ncbi:MAG: hypothetical protein WBG92_15720, partial [Thiohalocapsa sp.]